MDNVIGFWLGACIIAGGWQIGSWILHGLQWLYKRCCRSRWSAEEIMRREG